MDREAVGIKSERNRLDGGGEYKPSIQKLLEVGIEIHECALYNPNENGRTERKNQTLIDSV